MTELEQLMAQRREIDKRIKELRCPKIEVDGACLKRKSYQGKPLDTWVVTAEEIGGNGYSKELIIADTKEDVLECLELLIQTLCDLRTKASEES